MQSPQFHQLFGDANYQDR